MSSSNETHNLHTHAQSDEKGRVFYSDNDAINLIIE
jgi:hypothetical protein